jgi:hypothetical protein
VQGCSNTVQALSATGWLLLCAPAAGPAGQGQSKPLARPTARRPHHTSTAETDRKILKSAQHSAGVSCIKIPYSCCVQYVPEKLISSSRNRAAAEIERQLRRLLVFPRQRPPSRTPQVRRGARAAAGCERSSAGPCGGRLTLPAHPRPVVSGASSRW